MNHLFRPRHIERQGKNIPLFEEGHPIFQIVVADNAEPLVWEAAKIICERINYPESLIVREGEVSSQAGIFLTTPEGPSLFARLIERSRIGGAPANRDQAYEMEFLGNDLILLGHTPQALMYAARALADSATGEGTEVEVPDISVYDYPDLAYRGIYVECRWGPDNMTMDQWKEAVDSLAAMRMNIMSIGLYNNWPIQYDRKISEWMLAPLESAPRLKTPKLVNYYSPSRKENVRLEYVPRMYEEDLFGEIIKYAKSRGIIVRPHFNTPGHNTQIPRNYPETSAKFPDGTPKLYGFCMSNPATYEIMFAIFDEICDRYLLPNGIDMFHIGLDEVYPLVGMNEDMPLKRIDPWCECPDCLKSTPEDQFVEYAVRLAKHLKDKGINHIGMWHDHFERGGRMNEELARRFEAEGLKDNIIFHWWRYGDFFDTTMPELGFRRWVTPMTGYFYWMSYQDHLRNCFLAVEKGVEEGAEGTEAYGVWHKSYHQHYALLAAKSWNSENWPDIHSFRLEYAKILFGDRYREGLRGLDYFEMITGGRGLLNLTTRLFSYPYSYANSLEAADHRDNYPRPIIRQLLNNPLMITSTLGVMSGYADRAAEIFARDGLWAVSDPPLKDLYTIECRRIGSILDLFTSMVKGVKAFDSGADSEALGNAADEIQSAVEKLDSAMEAIETHWEEPFVPQALRELTLMRDFALRLSVELRLGRQNHELKAMKSKSIDWPND